MSITTAIYIIFSLIILGIVGIGVLLGRIAEIDRKMKEIYEDRLDSGMCK